VVTDVVTASADGASLVSEGPAHAANPAMKDITAIHRGNFRVKTLSFDCGLRDCSGRALQDASQVSTNSPPQPRHKRRCIALIAAATPPRQQTADALALPTRVTRLGQPVGQMITPTHMKLSTRPALAGALLAATCLMPAILMPGAQAQQPRPEQRLDQRDGTLSKTEVASGSLLLRSATPGRYVEAPLVAADVKMDI